MRNEKKKILFFIAAFLFFGFVMFPFSDVTDLVTAQISKATNNQVFLQFSNPGLSVFPGLGFELKDVHVETNFLPSIQASSVTISPSIRSLLNLKPGLSLSARKILGGDLDLSLQPTTYNGKSGQAINIESDSIELGELLKLAALQLPAKGKVNLTTSAEFEPSFADQPKGSLQLQINHFDLSSDTVATPLGPLNLPPVTLNKVNLQGTLADGRLNIEQLVAGQASDELTANVKGRVDLHFQPGNGAPEMQPGPFDLEVHLTTKSSFQQKAGLFLSFLSSYQKAGPDGTTLYSFRLKGQNFNLPPNLSPL
jgi:type II secretion system protein N